MDAFVIWSNDLCFQRGRERVETMARNIPSDQHCSGTLVLMEIAENTTRSMKQVFDEFCPPDTDDMTFTRTSLAVKLCTYDGKSAVSRSQGKRPMSRAEVLQRVALDFEGITTVGQGFADEVFRVWVKQHPHVELAVKNASEDALSMIRHVRSAAGLPPLPSSAPL